MLVSLKRAYPKARIDWLIQEGFEDAIRAHPDLSEVLPFPRKPLGEALRRGRVSVLRQWLGHLRSHNYDMVIDAQGLFRSGFFAWASGAKHRIGHASARELAWLFYTDRERGAQERHTVDQMLALVATAGAQPVVDMTLYAPPPDRDALDSDDRFSSMHSERYAVIAPTSRWPGKQWPAERFESLVDRLLAEGMIDRVAIVGSPGERDQCIPLLERAARDPRVVDLVGKTSIGLLMALIERSALVVANDSAALHMAVGFARPIVALFGPTRVELVGPYGHERDVLQHITPKDTLSHKDDRAGQTLMRRITVDEVVEACCNRLNMQQ